MGLHYVNVITDNINQFPIHLQCISDQTDRLQGVSQDLIKKKIHLYPNSRSKLTTTVLINSQLFVTKERIKT